MGETQVIITVSMGYNDFFGVNDKWEAALYEGAIGGEETDRRFTTWVKGQNNIAFVSVPENVRGDFEIPWDKRDDIYVRVRTIEGYPTFDVVSKPFTIIPGKEVVVPIVIHSKATII